MTPKPTTPGPMNQRASLALLAYLAFISLGLPDGLVGVAWPSIRQDFGLPLDALGLLVGFTTAGYLTSSFSSGSLLRVLPIGTVLALSTAAASAALLGYALTPFWPLMLMFGFLAGLGGGAIDAGLNAYGAAHFSARTLNWLHAFFGVGTTLGPLIVTGVLNAGLVWRWSYAVVGSAQALLAVTFFLTRGRWAQVAALDGSKTDTPSIQAARARDTLQRPTVWLGMLVFFVYTGVEFVAGIWSYTLLINRDVSEGVAGLFVSLYWGGLTAGRIVFGIIAERVPLVPALRVCMGAVLAGASLLWLEPTRPLSLTGLVMIGFFLAPVFASLISLTPARVGKAHADSAIGFQIAAAGLGGAVLVGGVGVVSRAVGLTVIGTSVVLFAALLLVLFEVLVRTKVNTT